MILSDDSEGWDRLNCNDALGGPNTSLTNSHDYKIPCKWRNAVCYDTDELDSLQTDEVRSMEEEAEVQRNEDAEVEEDC